MSREQRLHFRDMTMSWRAKSTPSHPAACLTFECVDEIPRCDQSNETSLPELSYGAICFSALYQMKFGNVVKF